MVNRLRTGNSKEYWKPLFSFIRVPEYVCEINILEFGLKCYRV